MMSTLKVGQAVSYTHYDATLKKAVTHAAIVLSTGDHPQLAYLDPYKLHLLNGANWQDAFTRAEEVPHEDEDIDSAHSYETGSQIPKSSELQELANFLATEFDVHASEEDAAKAAAHLLSGFKNIAKTIR